MGRKHQRTKGNLQASSSARAAQILQNKNNGAVGLKGFTSKDTTDVNTAIDPLLGAAIRKLSKKESITKQKALIEILDILTEDNVEGCLFLWSRVFPKICIDNDHKTRELAQQVNGKIAKLAGRGLAPHLSNIIGPWLEGTCDTYPTAALVAHDTLTTCFNEHKLVGAIHFCENSIVKHIKDRLTSSAATLSDMKQTDPVEAEEKYSRVIGVTLRVIIRVLALLKDKKSEKLTSLLQDVIVWKLGRSKNLQVRKHVYKCVSGICEKLLTQHPDSAQETGIEPTSETEYKLPEAAVKTISQNINSCNHDTTAAQWRAISDVLNSCPEVYWSHISEPDVKGQILDTLKSKALSAGVLEPVCLYLPNVSVAFYNQTKKESEEKALSWISSVLNNAIKCMIQCKQSQDKNNIVTLLFQLSTQIWCDATSEILLTNIGKMISVLSIERLSDSFAEQMYSALSNMANNVEISHHVNLLSQIKHTDHEIQNTLIICRVVTSLVCTCENNARVFYAELAKLCAARLRASDLKYVSLMMQHSDKISVPLYEMLTANDDNKQANINDDKTDTNIESTNETSSVLNENTLAVNDSTKIEISCSDSDVNNLTMIFVPLFANATLEQIDDLCLCTLILLQNTPIEHHKHLVTLFIDVSQHKHNILLSFLKQHSHLGNEISSKYHKQINSFIPVQIIINNFETFITSDDPVSTAIIATSAGLLEGLPELVYLFKSHLFSIVQEPMLSDKWERLLNNVDWNYLLVQEDSLPSTDDIQTNSIIHVIIENLENSNVASKWASVLSRIFQCVIDPKHRKWIEVCLDKLFGTVNYENYSALASNLVVMFGGQSDTVLKYMFNKKILTNSIRKTDTVYMDMNERYGIVQQIQENTTHKTNTYDHQTDPAIIKFLFCQYFLSKCTPLNLSNFSPEDYEDVCKIFYILLSTEYTLQIHTPALLKQSCIFKSLLEQDSEQLYYSVIGQFIRHNDMLIIYFVKDLMTLKHNIEWSRIESVASLPTDSLVNLASNFSHPGFTEVIKLRLERDKEITKTEKLLAMNYLSFKKEELSQDQLIDFLTEDCLDQEMSDICLAGCIFSTFQNIVRSDKTSDQDREFILCSTATVFQVCLDTFGNGKNNTCYLSYTSLQFRDLFLLLRDLILTQTSDNSTFSKFKEDWEVFFEPGIEDLVLAFQDKLLCSSFEGMALPNLSHIASLAPPSSVKTYMKQSLKSDYITFDMCFEYVMKLYRGHTQLLPYEGQNALFKLLLHCQNIFPTTANSTQSQKNEEELEFESPPQLFLEILTSVNLTADCSDAQYEHDLVLVIQIWCLLLRHEAGISADAVREHVDYLRSKNLVFYFLHHLLHFLRLSAKKYEIVKLEDIVNCDRFEQDQLAASCFMGIAAVFPALLRNWWKKLDKENTLTVEKFVTAFISPRLIKSETNLNIEESENLRIRARPVVREVVATYTMDDITADLTINIAYNHPLSPPSVSCERQVGVPLATWRSWMLQITSMFNNQNCSIVDGLEHWRKNMDKQFEGIESCMICFSVVQGPKKALPKPRCKTCKKKFHSACLYKWFSTSAKSTCPMCRSSFQHSSGLRSRLNEVESES